MKIRNRDGTPIDPVPFIVVSLLAAMVLIAWGPLYLMAHGFEQPLAVSVSVALTLLCISIAFYRFVWTRNPTVREEVPAATRYLRLVYGIAIGVILLLGLTALLYI
jgi:hypothetical protein